MDRVLFLGNSHLAAYKLAFDTLSSKFPRICEFYCARGADLAFTDVIDGALVPKATATMDLEELHFFFAEAGRPVEERYVAWATPLNDVGDQFLRTGGKRAIDLSGVSAIFYAAGTSPYDAARLGEPVFPCSSTLRKELLGRMLRDKALLRRQIQDIRTFDPGIRHYFLGAPLQFMPNLRLSSFGVEVVETNRAAISRIANDYIFDDVFMPGPSVLEDSLVSTRREFFANGRQEAETYQGFERTAEDNLHVNAAYAAIVFDEFIGPRLAEQS